MGMDKYSNVGSFEEMAQNESSESVETTETVETTEAGEVATEATTDEVVADNKETEVTE